MDGKPHGVSSGDAPEAPGQHGSLGMRRSAVRCVPGWGLPRLSLPASAEQGS